MIAKRHLGLADSSRQPFLRMIALPDGAANPRFTYRQRLAALPPETKAELYQKMVTSRAAHRVEMMKRVAAERTRSLTLVLEDVFQSHNHSAVLRSCECFGVQEVHVVEIDKPFRLINAVAMGGAKWIDLMRWKQTETCLAHLKASGFRIAAGTLDAAATPLRDLPLDQPLAVLIGHERQGLTQGAREAADLRFKLPVRGFTESFNLSVFGALCLYELTERIRRENHPWRLSEEEQLDLQLFWLCYESTANREIAADFLR